VRRPQSDPFGLLGWYPPGWRERYGEEFGALMEDTLGGGPPTPRFRLSIAWAGLRERGHEAGMIGGTSSAPDRTRAGSLLVLCAWAVFVVAGSSFAKLAEGFRGTVPDHARTLSTDAYRTVFVVGAVGAVLVVAGIAIALPAFLRFLRNGGWASIRGHVIRAVASTVVSLVAMVALVAVAHTLTPDQRNGGALYHPVVWYYLVQFIATVLVLAVMLALWTAAAVVTVRRLDLPRPVLSAESALAIAVTAAMVAMTAATTVWWGVMASSAPWFLQGRPAGSGGSPFNQEVVVTMTLMLVAIIVATYGVSRVARSRQQLAAPQE
jgi:hypothetical protein